MLESQVIRKNDPNWRNYYTENNAPVLTGKQKKNAHDLLLSLAINGPSTMKDAAKFVLSKTPSDDTKKEHKNRTQIFHNLIRNTKKDDEKYQREWNKYKHLTKHGYLIAVGEKPTKEKKKATLYTLTLKGCFVALGYNFNDNELKLFIRSMAKNHIFFAYVNAIMKDTSVAFIREIFIDPIQQIIKKGRITITDDIRFYFTNLAEACGYALYKKLEGILKLNEEVTEEYFHIKLEPELKNIQVIKNNTFYFEQEREDWEDSMIEYFYTEQEFYYIYRDDLDKQLLYTIMKDMHFAFFGAHAMGFPKYTNKLKRSKHWLEHIKYKRRARQANALA